MCKHPGKQVICGEVRCGKCYEQYLLTAPDRNRERKAFAEMPADGKLTFKFSGYGQKEAK